MDKWWTRYWQVMVSKVVLPTGRTILICQDRHVKVDDQLRWVEGYSPGERGL